ncbi:MAG: hypothetical protein ACTSU5_06015, partial [Promethearchaeota archaeon]
MADLGFFNSPAGDLTIKIFIASVFAFLLIGVAKHADNARKKDGTMKTENFQSLWAINVAIVLIVLFIVFKFDFTQETENEAAVLVPIFLFGTPLVLVCLYFLSNLVQAVLRKKPKKRRWGTEMAEYPDTEGKIKRRLDLQRKATHIIIFFSMFIIMAIIRPYSSQYDEYEFWGDDTGLTMIRRTGENPPFSVAQGILILFFYVLSLVFLFIEVTRISTWKYSHFPLHQTIQRTLRKKELDSIASYTHFSVGFLFASLFLMPTLLLAAFALFSLGDVMAATIGIRYGKHKISFNRDKSWEGTLGGFLFSFIPAMLFVGPVWGLLAGILFVV